MPKRRKLSRTKAAATYVRLVNSQVAVAFNIKLKEITAPTRTSPEIAFARQIAMYLTHTLFHVNLTHTAEFYGRDRTTVRYACEAIELAREDAETDGVIETIANVLSARKPESMREKLRVIASNHGGFDAAATV